MTKSELQTEPTPPKRKRGRPPKPRDENGNILRDSPSETPDEPAVPHPIEQASRSSLELAEAIVWAVENLSKTTLPKVKKGGKLVAPSALQKALWEYGKEDTKGLVVTLGMKALAVLERLETGDTKDEIVLAEEKACKELDGLLQAAIEEAQQ